MQKISAFALSIALVLAPSLAFADSSSNASASNANGFAQTVTPSQNQTNNVGGTSAPVGENLNIQTNNNQTTQYGYAPGISCQGASVAVSGYGAAQNAAGMPANNAYGANVSLVVPIGGKASQSCNELAHQVVLQRQLDTCITILKSGFTVDATVAPELARQCSMLKAK